jgi:hypothetical protein
MNYILMFYKLCTTILQPIQQTYSFIFSFIHLMWMDFIPILCTLFTTILQLAWWIYSFIFHSSIWQMDFKYPYLLQFIYNYFITSLTNTMNYKCPSWLTSHFLLMDMYILITCLRLEWHLYFWLINLIKVTYLTIYQIEHLVKLDKTKWYP